MQMTFFGGYIHDVSVSHLGSSVFVVSKCFASQKKGTVYHQNVIFEKDIEASEDAAAFSGHFCTVVFATCEGCVAGADGGLCSHVIALFLVLEKYRTSSRAVTSLPRSWGPRQRNIYPNPS